MNATHSDSLGRAPTPGIAPDRVVVWRVSLIPSDERVRRLRALLSGDEIARADRFHFQRHRDRFTIARGALRSILSTCVGADPRAIRFAYGPQGKPSLANAETPDDIRFNVSHSEDLALVAVAPGRELGVDVECVRDLKDFEVLARRFFAAGEVAALESLDPPSRREAFFACWTRKEAFLKAKGGGLSVPLREFEVSVLPGEEAALRGVEWDPSEAARWRLASLSVAEGYAAALAVEGDDWTLEMREWADTA
ncbi:4'-phosphopantetheinyl transferase superfamily protein [Candidatus Sumerlaeota bacterium]|nr:4'-phosphopantetheinyl transferase superfamily protein [Candidatus Sumerlaeota bacterium]